MPFGALDLHKKIVEAVLLDDAGNTTHSSRFPATGEAILAFANKHLTKDHHIAIEATTNTWPVVALLEPFAASITVSNPMATRAIAYAKVKTDKVDALVLAQLLRVGFLPKVWTPDAQTRQLRQLATERANFTADRTRVKNRIHSILHQRLIEAPEGDLFSKENLAWLGRLPLDPLGKQALDSQLFFLEMIQTETEMFTDHLARLAYKSPQVQLLMTIPGVDFPTAQSILAMIGDWSRFPNADKAAAYFGLVPSTHQSAEKCYHGSITKHGNGHARWMLVQAAQHLDTHPGPVGVFFRRIAKRKNRNVAVVATARKLVAIAWHMLKNNEPYRYADPKSTEAKMSRLRVRATGKKRKGGTPKGQPRPAAYGTGNPTRGIKSLDEVYAREGLPPVKELSAGERKMCHEQAVDGYAAAIRQSRRVPRKENTNKQNPPKASAVSKR
jgi:transposase